MKSFFLMERKTNDKIHPEISLHINLVYVCLISQSRHFMNACSLTSSGVSSVIVNITGRSLNLLSYPIGVITNVPSLLWAPEGNSPFGREPHCFTLAIPDLQLLEFPEIDEVK